MVKPIFLVGVPFMGDNENFERLSSKFASKLIDYYVIFYQHNKNEYEFRVFYEKDFDEVKFEELKEIVKSSMV